MDMADPDVTQLQIARAEQSERVEQRDPVTGLPFPTGTARAFVDLAQATILLDKEQ
jgi:hypothetical protein